MRTTIFTFVSLSLVYLTICFPTNDQLASDAMIYPPPLAQKIVIPKNDHLSGIPGSDNEEFPENLPFALPCEDMVEENKLFVQTPLPTPTPQIYPLKGDLSFEIVSMIQLLGKLCPCESKSLILNETFFLATKIFHSLPIANFRGDFCHEYLATHPWPPHAEKTDKLEVPQEPLWIKRIQNITAPSELPEQIKQDIIRFAEKKKRALEESSQSDNTQYRLYLTKRYEEAVDEAHAHLTKQAENLRIYSEESVVLPIPVVPMSDCDDETTGGVGIGSDNVKGATDKMNQNYRPVPDFSRSVKRAHHAAYHIMMLEEQVKVGDCTEYAATKIGGSLTILETFEADSKIECAESCLFEEKCTSWTLDSSISPKKCSLIDSASPVLVNSNNNFVSAICKKPKYQPISCSSEQLNKIETEFQKISNSHIDCNGLFLKAMNKSEISSTDLTGFARDGTCRCVLFAKSKIPQNDCAVYTNGISVTKLVEKCVAMQQTIQLIQHKEMSSSSDNNNYQITVEDPRKFCQSTIFFNSGFGGCETYSISTVNSNFIQCDGDFDQKLQLVANQACPQCGLCRATPSPTPYIPEPEEITSASLPDGTKTECLSARNAAIHERETGPGLGSFVPSCFKDGSFMPKQCSDDECWCVYGNGVEVPATRYNFLTSESTVECRLPPPMDPVYPYFQPAVPNAQLQAARALAKLVLQYVSPEEFCRPHKNTTVEQDILKNLRKANQTRISQFSSASCASLNLPKTNDLTSILTSITRCLIPPIVPTSSPSSSPSPSSSATVSNTPSPSPSSPVPMCGNVSCKEKGINVHIYHNAPPGWCTMCLEGTSGPCRDKKTFACSDYTMGDTCFQKHVKCSDVGAELSADITTPDCPHVKEPFLLKTFVIPTPFSHDWNSVWGKTFQSAISDVIEIFNLCDIRILRFGPITRSQKQVTEVTVALSGSDEDDAKRLINLLTNSITYGHLISAMRRRGMEIVSV
eukprot:c21232_g1_i1.p1 GENE.c21232_g1_i1~~c21232_g1_i1.p1  ORF type:complete len:985 (-),score=440.84 c21232_g1_i1:3-2933(-)